MGSALKSDSAQHAHHLPTFSITTKTPDIMSSQFGSINHYASVEPRNRASIASEFARKTLASSRYSTSYPHAQCIDSYDFLSSFVASAVWRHPIMQLQSGAFETASWCIDRDFLTKEGCGEAVPVSDDLQQRTPQLYPSLTWSQSICSRTWFTP